MGRLETIERTAQGFLWLPSFVIPVSPREPAASLTNLSGTCTKLFGWGAGNLCAPPFIPTRR
jgi:hypothetical protein